MQVISEMVTDPCPSKQFQMTRTTQSLPDLEQQLTTAHARTHASMRVLENFSFAHYMPRQACSQFCYHVPLADPDIVVQIIIAE